MNNIQWVKNKLAAMVQSVILVVALALLLGLVGRLLGGNQLAVMMIAGVVILYFISPKMSPSLFLKFNSGRRLLPEKAPQLYGILEHLARKAELTRLPVLYYMPTDTMLAFTVGPRDNAVIAVSEGLIRGLSRQELAAVLAHEVSHIRHNDIRIMTFAGMAGQLTHMLSIFGQFILIISLPLILTGQVFISWTAIFLLIFSPTLSSLIQLALSRTREYNADMSAAELMGNPEPLASALAKIERAAQSAYRRMFWPMVPRLPQVTLLRTHPPTKERIRRLLDLRDNKRGVLHDFSSAIGNLNQRSCAPGVGRCVLNVA